MITETAFAKINLCLHVTGQRPDGYHLLDSLVAFADAGDVITCTAADRLALTISGPQAAPLPVTHHTLVLCAPRSPPCPKPISCWSTRAWVPHPLPCPARWPTRPIRPCPNRPALPMRR